MTSDHDGRMDAEGVYNASQDEVTHVRDTVEISQECDSVDVEHREATIKRKRTLWSSQPLSKDDDRETAKRFKLDIHLMPVRDIPQIITSASPPAANNISLALDDHCALSKSIPVDSTAFSCSIIHEYPVDNECSASSDPSNTESVVTDPVEDMDMMTGGSPAYGTLSEVTGDSFNREREDANGSEDDRETGGSIVEVTAADTQGSVSNNGTSDSSARSVSPAVAKTTFVNLSGEHVPPAIPAWINALKMVDRSPSRIRVPPGVGTGFRWPDPALFTHTESNTQLARYLLHYLSCRSWLGLVNRRALFRSIYWKDLLEGLSVEKQLKRSPPNSRIYSILNRGHGIDEGEARVIREQALDAFEADAQETEDVFKWVDVQFNGRLAMTFEFRGLAFQLKDLLKFPSFVISQIIWELCEHNFADDVLWLDVLFRRGRDSTDTYGPERSMEVYSLCGKQESNTPMPLVRSSFGSQRWRERVTYVEAFRQLMSTWSQFPDHLKTPVPT
ncbi:uncharacterized protein EDB93DRAFT_1256975 [Suillus bovinus]|uniref:uncharacterized protein n=1 Tax=Suillus bovinus TaxID=48563 RepID=UPI001B85E271|nr:uncharacterized protein EDB93DRAFT_1256975 [Suillus bovinus]KAG2127578.1 hypothetical protein EDB93DRAFT_1256975 [Suillus bovinus]